MLRNVLHFAFYNFLGLVGLVVVAQGMIFVGSVASSLFAATALYYRYKKIGVVPSKINLIVTAICCSIFSTGLCLGFELVFLEHPSDLPVPILLIATFFIVLIFVLIILKGVYITDAQVFENLPVNKSPVIKRLMKYCTSLSSFQYYKLSNQDLIKASAGIQPLICALTVLISVLVCSVVWVFLNRSLHDYPILVLSALALAIILIQLWSVNMKLIKQELEARFLNK